MDRYEFADNMEIFRDDMFDIVLHINSLKERRREKELSNSEALQSLGGIVNDLNTLVYRMSNFYEEEMDD